MCCCGRPTINGTVPVKMTFNTPAFPYPPNPPELREGETLFYDEPGRCSPGSDSHAYHFRVTVERGRVWLLVRHGGGDERMEFGWANTMPDLTKLDSFDRYWLFAAIFHGTKKATRDARETERAEWTKAAA